MAKNLTPSQITQAEADAALDQMFGYYNREAQPATTAALTRAGDDKSQRVVSELDAAATIPATRHAA